MKLLWLLSSLLATWPLLAQVTYPVKTEESNLLVAPYDDIVIDTAYNYGDIRRYGAVPDTNSEKAIDFACLAMAQIDGDVLIPVGTFLIGAADAPEGLDGQIVLTNTHNGLTIRGYGYDSVLKRADAVNVNLAVIYMGTSDNQVKDITLDGFRIDGNRAGQTSSPPPSQRNIWVDGFNNALMLNNRKPPGNIVIQNMHSHSAALTGVFVSAETSQTLNLTTWDNAKHGLSVGAPNDFAGPGHQALVEGLHSYANGSYGVDVTARVLSGTDNLVDLNTVTIRNFLLEDNAYGIKFACYTISHLSDGTITGSTNQAINTTNEVRQVDIHDVVTRDNGGPGLNITDAGNYRISNFTSVDDVDGIELYYQDSKAMNVAIKGTTIRSAAERPMNFSGNMNLTVEDFLVDGIDSPTLNPIDIKVAETIMRNGTLRKLDGKYGFRVFENATLINIRFEPTPGATSHGMNLNNLASTEWLVLTNVDFTPVTGTKLFLPDPAPTVVKNRVTGLP